MHVRLSPKPTASGRSSTGPACTLFPELPYGPPPDPTSTGPLRHPWVLPQCPDIRLEVMPLCGPDNVLLCSFIILLKDSHMFLIPRGASERPADSIPGSTGSSPMPLLSCLDCHSLTLSLLVLPPPLGKVHVPGTGRLKVDLILMGQEAELLSHVNPGSLCPGYLSLEM